MIRGQPTHPTIPANIAILWSEETRRWNGAEAARQRAIYTFTDAWGQPKSWLKGQYAYLAPNAASVALNRFNLKHDLINDARLLQGLDEYDLLLLPSARALSAAMIDAIANWLQQTGKFLCVIGPTNLPPALLGLASLTLTQPAGYTAWQWRAASPFSDHNKWETWYISGHQGFITCQATPLAQSVVLADQVEITGDLTSPQTAAVRNLGAGIVKTAQTLFVANALFDYLGGVWQAHLNNEEVRCWFNATHWAETLLYQFRGALWEAGLERFWQTRLRSFGSYTGAMNIRHDPDDSSDETMLRYEGEHLIPATWTLLDVAFSPESTTSERDLGWVRAISQYEFIEAGLHNDALQGSPPTWMLGANLAHHVAESEKNLGIRLYTGGRHGGYSVYPEMIDAMDHLYQTIPHFLGLGTFHFHFMTEYGVTTPGVMRGGKTVTYATNTTPTIAAPGFWFPLHGVVSATTGSHQLRGWDMTHEYDSAPDLVDLVYARPNSKDGDPATALPDGVYQFQYHPLFTSDPDYNNGRGTFDWMCYAIRRAERLNLWHASQQMIYARLQDYEDVAFRLLEGGKRIQVQNPTDRVIAGLMVECSARLGAPESAGPGALGPASVDAATRNEVGPAYLAVHWGERYLAHIVQNRFFTLPPLQPGETITVVFAPGPAPHPLLTQANSKSLQVLSASFDPLAQTFMMQLSVIRHQGLIIQNFRPYELIQVEIDGLRRQPLTADGQGRLRIFTVGPENRFVTQQIILGRG